MTAQSSPDRQSEKTSRPTIEAWATAGRNVAIDSLDPEIARVRAATLTASVSASAGLIGERESVVVLGRIISDGRGSGVGTPQLFMDHARVRAPTQVAAAWLARWADGQKATSATGKHLPVGAPSRSLLARGLSAGPTVTRFCLGLETPQRYSSK